MKNKILDYSQAKEKLVKLISEKKIKKQNNLGISKYGLPIEYYTLGDGKRDIVITGATHGSEIITTDFVIQLMEKLQNSKEIDLRDYKFHFVPILNPEGYLIATSAIRKLIPRDMDTIQAEKICHSYYEAYKQDDLYMIARKKQKIDIDRTSIKKHQQFFENVDYNCIPEEYENLRESIKNILEKYPDLPRNCLHIWSANGDGIDIQANCMYNPAINKIENGEKIYKDELRHSNIDISHPGPINCPYDKEKGFYECAETKAIKGLLGRLNNRGNLKAYYNYHGTGGLLYQRLPILPENFKMSDSKLWKGNLTNYLLARSYEENSKYRILKGSYNLSSSNDFFKTKYPQNILVELSKMGGNPIGPYGDIEGNYNNIIQSNIDSFIYSIKINELTEKVAEEASKVIQKKLETKYSEIDLDSAYEIMDLIYTEFSEKVHKLEKNKNDEEKALEK